MKITKEKLKKLIQEEVAAFQVEESTAVGTAAGIGSSEMAKRSRDLGKAQGADPKEGDVATNLAQKLMAAAKVTNIRAGAIGALLGKLFAELERTTGGTPPEA